VTDRFRDRFRGTGDGDRSLNVGDAVTVTAGTFESFDGTVGAIDEEFGKVTVMIEVFGRRTPVELEYWQVEKTDLRGE